MATHSRILALEIPWTEESGGLQSMSCKESHTTEQLSTAQQQKRTPNVEKILSSVNAAGKTWYLHAEE